MILVFSMLAMCGFFVLFSILTCIVLTFRVAYFVRVCVCVGVRLYLSILFIYYFLILLLVCMPRQISWCFFPSLCHLLINTWSLL